MKGIRQVIGVGPFYSITPPPSGPLLRYRNHDTYRNFFVFDLSGLSGVVTSAMLRLQTDPVWVNGTPNYEIYDVTTDIATLLMSHSPGGTTDAIYTDLGSGVLYGSGTVTNASPLFDFTLNASATTLMTTAIGGLWALGGRNSLLDDSYAFWNTGKPGFARQLIVETQSTVPEPTSLLLLGTGLAGLALAAWRRRK